MVISQRRNTIWLVLLLLVISSNFAIYNTRFLDILKINESSGVVVGSLVDLMIVTPILLMLYLKKFSWTRAIAYISIGCVLARFIIPSAMLTPYKSLTTAGIAAELCLLLIELAIIGTFVFYIPKVLKEVKANRLPDVFSYPKAVQKFSKGNVIVKMLSSEIFVAYYAFATWKRKPQSGITLHKDSSYIAFQIMLIHAIVLESLGFHWWLHSKAPILSIILLFINVYGIIFLLGDMQAMKLNPIYRTNNGFYISFGLMKRAHIVYENIEEVILQKEQLQQKKRKGCVEFILRDFEQVFPQVILKMKQPQTVEYLYGNKKVYDYVAIKCDNPSDLIESIRLGMERSERVD